MMGEIPEVVLTPTSEIKCVSVCRKLELVFEIMDCSRKVVSFIPGQLRHRDDKIVDLVRAPLIRSFKGEFSLEERIDQTCNNPT